jgi:hypothetical protein
VLPPTPALVDPPPVPVPLPEGPLPDGPLPDGPLPEGPLPDGPLPGPAPALAPVPDAPPDDDPHAAEPTATTNATREIPNDRMGTILPQRARAGLDFAAPAHENGRMRAAFTLLALPLLLGCSATHSATFGSGSSGSSGSGGGAGAGSGSGTGSGTGGSASGSTGTGGVHLGAGGSGSTGPGTGTGGGTMENAEVFGQSDTTLYKLDPLTKVVTTVGDFQGCGTVIDIALDKDDNMYATTFGGVYKVDKTTAVCTLIAQGGFPNSLSFVPAGTLDPNVEALVGYDGNQYLRIDTATGQVSYIGSGTLGNYTSSGDIVSVIGGGTYLTVNGPGCNLSDCIVEVDPKTGSLIKVIGQVGHGQVFGLAFWGGSAYGFDNAGELFQIDLTNGTSTTIPIPNAPPLLSFYGAGSTTSAPLKPPTQ